MLANNNNLNINKLNKMLANNNNKNDKKIRNLLNYIQNPDKINDIGFDKILNIFSKAHFLQMDSLMELLIKRLIDLKIYTTYFD